ncbi:MAG: AAA family ATPase [bacterium]|nr:AAA family ATPase [bacterium]
MNEHLLAAVAKQLKQMSGNSASGSTIPRLKEGENREIAILFLDLKGFTALSETMSHEELHRLMHDENGGILTSLSRVVEKYGGYIDKEEGDLLMVLFGAEQATENDAKRAVACALELLETVERVNSVFQQFDLHFGARIGINYGYVTFAPDSIGHLTATGKEVSLASRLESTADVNTVQVSESVYHMTNDDFIWSELGTKQVKGIDRPIVTYRPLAHSPENKMRWQRRDLFHRTPFIGRDSEMSHLLSAWETGLSSKNQNPRGFAKHLFVDVTGVPGIGKSRFVHEFLTRIAETANEPVIVVRGNTASFAQPPFYLWITALRDYFQTDANPDVNIASQWMELAAHSSLSETRRDSTQTILQQLLTGQYLSGDSNVTPLSVREEINAAIRDWLQALLEKNSRVVFVLDDLHWLDSGSQEALEYILSNCSAENPLHVIGIHRPEREDGSLLEFTLRDKYVELVEMQLEPLTMEATGELAQSILVAYYNLPELPSLPTTIGTALYQFSQGNPFYTEELLLDWLESERLLLQDSAWQFQTLSPAIRLPATISALIRSRMDRLPPAERKSLQECSVLGLEFTFRLYRRIKEKLSDRIRVEPTLQALVFHEYLKSISSIREHAFRFRMTTTHDVAYETVLRENRMLLHKLTAEALEEQSSGEFEDVSEALFRHWLEADETARALPHGNRALHQYRSIHQTTEAKQIDSELEAIFLRHSHHAKTIWREEYRKWLFSSESLAELTGNQDRRRQLLERCTEVCSLTEQTFESADFALRWGNYYLQANNGEQAQPHYEIALTTAEQIGERTIYGFAMGNLGLLALQRKEYEDATQRLSVALQCFQEIDHPLGISTYASNLGGLYYTLRQYDECEKYLMVAKEAYHRYRNRRLEANVLANYASLLSLQSRWEDAIHQIKQAVELLEFISERKSLGIVKSNLGYYYSKTGAVVEGRKILEEALELHEETNDTKMKAVTMKRLTELL